MLAHIRNEMKTRCSMYIDDMILMGKNQSCLRHKTLEVVKLLQDLGFQVNDEKSVLEPSQQIKHLGFIIDSTQQTVGLPLMKKVEVKKKCKDILNAVEEVKIRNVARVLGIIGAFLMATKWEGSFS